MLVEFGKANLISGARQLPEKAKMVLENVTSKRVVPTHEAMQVELTAPRPLGYRNAFAKQALLKKN